MLDKMIARLPANTGRNLEEWIAVLKEQRKTGQSHKQQVDLLMTGSGLGLNYADLIVHKANGTDSGSMDHDTLLNLQYKGKESLRPMYDTLLASILAMGNDIEVIPKKAYVSLRRKKQFACLKPATKTRFELGLILKGQPAEGILQSIPGAGAICTHRICLEQPEQITREVHSWIEKAYRNAI